MRHILLAVLLTLPLFSGCWRGEDKPVPVLQPVGPSGEVGPKRGGAPAFELKDAGGASHRLEEFRGQPSVIHFWASWCAPCVDEIPRWLAAARAYQGKPVRWLAVNLDESWEDARKVLKDSDLPANVISVIDVERKVPEAFGSFQFPESYLLDAELGIAHKWVGGQDWSGAGVRARIDGLLINR